MREHRSQTIADLQARLQSHAEPETKAWWEGYVKGGHPFRGVPMGKVRREVHGWAREHAADLLPDADAFALSLHLLRQPLTEDKLAGILLTQEILIPEGKARWEEALPAWADLFHEAAIADWNVCDCFCVKVLGSLVEREGESCARSIGDWRTAVNLWQRRASAVAFVNLAKRGEENFPGFTGVVLASCDALLRDPARFSQTGAGWVLRELSRAEPDRVAAFIEERLPLFSREALASAVRKLPETTAAALRIDNFARLVRDAGSG